MFDPLINLHTQGEGERERGGGEREGERGGGGRERREGERESSE